MCERLCERKRDKECVCVCTCQRVCASERVWGDSVSERECMLRRGERVCERRSVWWRESVLARKSVCKKVKESLCVNASVCVGARESVCERERGGV